VLTESGDPTFNAVTNPLLAQSFNMNKLSARETKITNIPHTYECTILEEINPEVNTIYHDTL
ncbi:hypothetical protein, partial [Salmonella sp. s51228]|uniref:hypothetical protein n=1 Tax=Salmonella sp. s51228 TaxID=3159652 RepID=UPI003980AA30